MYFASYHHDNKHMYLTSAS